ncbi:scavenger receptor cysteine-rich domain-containing protein DMBT1-like [Leptodactylus fuscus]|uniref:scavenger receptor cysteine-rich domain-containing protein DMBT1-like n=1 Tax=Leptodactylus fuscus TaxID=238119 RepID=UPI003F4EB002
MALRLVNGRSRCDGRVEIFYNGQWGTVCDDYWNIKNAEVVCQQLGCGNATAFNGSAAFGPGQGYIVLDDVLCKGNERYLWKCPHRGFLSNNCIHSEDVGVVCSVSQMALRLVNGRSRCDGRVEIRYNGQWGTVCDDGWNIMDAEVVCQQLGCGNALACNSSAAFGQGQGSIILDNVQCKGNERYLWECPHQGILSHNCAHNQDAGVVCSASQMALRLVNGRNLCEGRVEVLYNRQWGTVCDDLWDIMDAEVVCQQIGCGNATAFNGSAAFGQGEGPIILDDLQCYCNEPHLWDCPHSGFLINNCGHNEDVGVVCAGPPLTLRLANGRSRCDGRVEILYNGHWGTVCDDYFDILAAEVVCQQLGCGNALAFKGSAAFGPGQGNIILDNVQCNGNELHLWDCSHNGFLSHNCGHYEDVGVVCSGPILPMALRLVNGGSRCDGRVEILYDRQWGTVCDDNWNIMDAEVVCQQLGCGNALAFNGSAAFGPGQGPIIFADVQCNGNELHLWDCPHSGFLSNNCDHREDVGVVCSVKCGGILTNLYGEISLTSNISSQSDSCTWYISVTNSYRIHLNFRSFM